MEDEKTDFRLTLDWHRRRLGLTQQELANASKVSSQTISRAERGQPISKKSFELLCLVFGVEPDPKKIKVNLINSVRKQKEKSQCQ